MFMPYNYDIEDETLEKYDFDDEEEDEEEFSESTPAVEEVFESIVVDLTEDELQELFVRLKHYLSR
jgi:hypothetical protein